VPSRLHEALLQLFRNRPALAPELMRRALHLELPQYTDACDVCPSDATDDASDSDSDSDGDGVCDEVDNCPYRQHADQHDADQDGLGDACDAWPNDVSDSDADGVPNTLDECARTPSGELVDPANGCSIGQLCACAGGWKTHGQYVACVTHAVQDLANAGVIDGAQKGAIVSAAGQSSCGKP
jgi:hypothetical protein